MISIGKQVRTMSPAGTMTTIYAVFKTAVYRHECGGLFSSLELAEQAARSLMGGEPDDVACNYPRAFARLNPNNQ